MPWSIHAPCRYLLARASSAAKHMKSHQSEYLLLRCAPSRQQDKPLRHHTGRQRRSQLPNPGSGPPTQGGLRSALSHVRCNFPGWLRRTRFPCRVHRAHKTDERGLDTQSVRQRRGLLHRKWLYRNLVLATGPWPVLCRTLPGLLRC